MITLKRLNVVKVVSSNEDAAKWQAKGFEIVEPVEKDNTKDTKKDTKKEKENKVKDAGVKSPVNPGKDGDENGNDQSANLKVKGGTETEPQT